MHATSTRRVKVEPGGEGVVGHVGLHALGAFADRLGLGDCLSARIPVVSERVPLHDRGKVLVQTALVVAGGGESCADVEHLRAQADLFGSVPSDSTVFRAFHEITPAVRAGLAEATAEVRAKVWARSADTTGNRPVYLDIDSTLVEVHSENKDQTGPTYKGGFGFHPMFCFADATGEALSGLLRPGNAGANTAADHVTVLDAAISQLPEGVAVGHRCGEDPEMIKRQIVMRTDSAGSTAGFVSALRARNIFFMTVAATNADIQAAIFDAEGIEAVWQPALRQNGETRDGSAVCELTSLVDLSSWPEGTRLIVRREPLHPGAQRSLFPSMEFRYWGFYTDCDGDPVTLDVTMRAHAHVENHIERLKDSGLCRFPFSHFEANANWMAIVMLSADLVRWFQLICCDGYWATARPKALRWGLLHAPGRLIRSGRQHIVRILDGWPTAEVLLGAYRHIQALT
jgi:Transposase DDE domain group 1